MHEISSTLNEPIEDVIILQQGDNPLLEVTLYDWDGTVWDTGYDATLKIGRSTTDPDEWEIIESPAVPFVENVFLFNLSAITNTRGTYYAHVVAAKIDEATPLATPDDVEYSFQVFKVEVI